MRILLAEDEQKIAQSLRRGLVEDSYSVDISSDGEDALFKFSINEYDLVILDLMIPKLDGISVCKKIRQKNPHIPILILTAKDDVDTKVEGLDAGADDYVVKPFTFTELSARIRALLRRGNKSDPVILKVGDLELDPAAKTIQRAGEFIFLTSREYSLLEYMMRNPGKVLTKSQIMDHVWDYSYEGISNVVETYIKYLRKKLKVRKDSRQIIFTLRGLGYMLKG